MNDFPDWEDFSQQKLPDDINKAIIDLRTIMGNTMDLNVMEFTKGGVRCAVVTIEAMVSTSAMAELVFRPIMNFDPSKSEPAKSFFEFLSHKSLLANERKLVCGYGEIAQLLFSGFAVILIDTIPLAAAFGIQGYETKSISEPVGERNVMGSQEGFAEVIRTNISLIRRRMKTPTLRFEMMQIGEKTSTDVCMVYLADKAAAASVDKIRKRLKGIKLDTIMASGFIHPFLEDSHGRSLFSSVCTTERPDKLCLKLNEGKIAVLIDGTPFALVCQTQFADNFRAIDDYCTKPYYAAFLRWIRYTAFFLAVAFPGIYVAVCNYHPEVLTLELLLNLAASEQATPYPLFFEMLIIMLLLELMREASIRLPNAVGSAVSIVGGLVIGDAAVASGIISTPLLIIVGITATASFVIPTLSQQTSLLRLVFIIAGGAAGFFGIAVCAVMIIANICATDVLDVAYTAPISPFSSVGIKDVLGRRTFRQMAKDDLTVQSYMQNQRE